jgi:hypothetical protein
MAAADALLIAVAMVDALKYTGEFDSAVQLAKSFDHCYNTLKSGAPGLIARPTEHQLVREARLSTLKSDQAPRSSRERFIQDVQTLASLTLPGIRLSSGHLSVPRQIQPDGSLLVVTKQGPKTTSHVQRIVDEFLNYGHYWVSRAHVLALWGELSIP